MIGRTAFDQGDGLGQGADIAGPNAGGEFFELEHGKNLKKRGLTTEILCSLSSP
jgi:hypothetical protein